VQPHWAGHTAKAAWLETPESGNNKIAQGFKNKQIDTGWRIGENVQHQKFGEGVIVNIEGSGSQARANINFGRHGMKLLDLGIAKLEKIN
jgi:DNA helicase-2/ATP-dependent DNA helicase PcrA